MYYFRSTQHLVENLGWILVSKQGAWKAQKNKRTPDTVPGNKDHRVPWSKTGSSNSCSKWGKTWSALNWEISLIKNHVPSVAKGFGTTSDTGRGGRGQRRCKISLKRFINLHQTFWQLYRSFFQIKNLGIDLSLLLWQPDNRGMFV